MPSTSRRRVVLAVVVTIALIGAMAGLVAYRLAAWHEAGWAALN